jgi:hypothetical protein
LHALLDELERNLRGELLGIAWMTWWGSWMAAGVSTAIGVLLGLAHLVARRVAPTRA